MAAFGSISILLVIIVANSGTIPGTTAFSTVSTNSISRHGGILQQMVRGRENFTALEFVTLVLTLFCFSSVSSGHTLLLVSTVTVTLARDAK